MVRVYKSRTLATVACRGGHVEIDGQKGKPSRPIKPGEVVSARVVEITRTVKVLGMPPSRVGPKLVKEYAEDLTPESEYAKLRERRFEGGPIPIKGFGRPTKKSRRELQRLRGKD